jgi:ATP-dependent helicase/nuclease subunit A
MTAVRWTKEQEEAIRTPGRLLVAAAAGSGKTAVLVERILYFLLREEDPLELDEMLVVTYTRAAAAEMQERVRQALDKALAEETRPEKTARVLEQLALLPQAEITTLHSFCLRLLRRHASLIGLKPGFRVGDEQECGVIREEVLAAVAEEYYRSRGAEMAELVRYATDGFGDGPFLTQIKSLYAFAVNEPDPEEWLRRLPEPYRLSPAELLARPWGEAVRRHWGRGLESARDCLRLACHLAGGDLAPTAWLETLKAEFAALERLSAAERRDFEQAENWPDIFTARLPAARPLSGWDEENRRTFYIRSKKIKDLRWQAKKLWREAKKEITDWPLREQAEAAAGCADLAAQLAEWTLRFMTAFRRRKLELNIMDYNDLEYWTLKLLSAPDFSGGIFRQILVDEYQDINGVQERILELAAGAADFFLVGDVKQSIYRFRRGDPGLFLQKYRSWEQVVRLKKNFRSRPDIVAGVNALFARIMSEEAGEIDYDAREALVYGAPYPPPPADERPAAGPVECCCFDAAALQSQREKRDTVKETEIEAVYTAGRILQLVRPTTGRAAVVFDRALNAYRPAAYADIAVLMRGGAGQMSVYKDVFARFGIPCFGETAAAPYRPAEVEMITALLRILDNPHQDIPLATVLHSPLAGFDSDDLALIRAARPEADFWDAALAAAALRPADEGEARLAEKLIAFFGRYARWRGWLRHYPLDELIWRLYEETGLPEVAEAATGGAYRRENLEEFYRQARQFSAGRLQGLYSFLRYLDRLAQAAPEQNRRRSGAPDGDYVRLSTVHGAKGLEYPIVFLVGLGRKFNRRDMWGKLLLHKDLGAGLRAREREQNLFSDTFQYKAIRYRLADDALAEEMRILYVAMTRAREKLILLGSGRDMRAALEHAQEERLVVPLTPARVAQAADYLTWVTLAVEDGAGWRTLLFDRPEQWGEILRGALTAEGESEAGLPAPPLKEQPAREPEPFIKATVSSLKAAYPWATEPEATGPDLTGARTEPVFVRPLFLGESQVLTPAEKGSAVHLFLQHIPLELWRESWAAAGPGGQTDMLARLGEALTRDLLLTPEQAASLDYALLRDCLNGDLGAYLFRGRNLRREAPFLLRVEYGNGPVLVQGVVDLIGEDENGRRFLLDYKTDALDLPHWQSVLLNRYALQMAVYHRAASSLSGRPVERCLLYAVAHRQSVEVPAARLEKAWADLNNSQFTIHNSQLGEGDLGISG